MKNRILLKVLLLVLVFICNNEVFSQAPQGFSYQAVIRNTSGQPLVSQSVKIQITLSDQAGTTIHYKETHALTTSPLGLVNLTVGTGTVGAGTFSAIPWQSGEVYIKVEVDPAGGTTYTDLGTTRFYSVPYAFYASNGPTGPAGNGIASVSDNGDGTLTLHFDNGTSYVTPNLKGPQGIQGPAGPTGAQGTQGVAGPAGAQGIQGAAGPTGSQGVQGPAGPKGDKGDSGTGLTNRGAWGSGTTYNPSDYVFAESTGNPAVNSMWIVQASAAFASTILPKNDLTKWVEFQAPQGPAGPLGPIGPKGDQGSTGSQGLQGIQGPQGGQGPVGQQGIQGLQGLTGANGISIVWKGESPSHIASPSTNWAYYNTTDKKSYVYDGDSWEIITQDGAQGPTGPMVAGTDGQTLRNNGTTWEASSLLFSDKTNSRVGVNTASPSATLHINGTARLGGLVYDNNNLPGSDGNVLTKTAGGVVWQAPAGVSGTGTAGKMALWSGASTLASLPNVTFTNSLEIQGSAPTTIDDPIFEVKNSAGQVIFGVYQEGVRINIADGIITKGARGGFAVGGLTTQNKVGPAEYLRITPDSARIYVKEVPATKGARGGFAVGGLTTQNKAVTSNQLIQLTPKNYFIGYQSGTSINGGLYNSFFGYQSGKSTSTGGNNIFLGYQSGFNNTSGYKNNFIGFRSGFNNTTGYSNIFIGDSAGFVNSSGYNNVFIGNQSGRNNTVGSLNVASGYRTLFNNISGNSNVANGEVSLYSNTTGSANTASGLMSLYSNSTANANTATGYQTLYSNNTGNANTAVGTQALFSNTTGNGNTALGYRAFLALDNISNSTAIGAYTQVTISNQVRLGDPNVVWIGGQVGWSTVSDGRFKNIVKDEVKGLDFITRLNPVIYNFDTQKYDEFLLKNTTKSIKNEIVSKKDYTESKAIKRSGFVAQDVEKAAKESGFIFNGVHHPENDNDNYSIDYSLLTVPLVKAVQELNAKNEEQQKQIESLKTELETIKALLKK
ncbi:MAG: tail fiber domain-containing protein [Tenuifilaceae bacterium]